MALFVLFVICVGMAISNPESGQANATPGLLPSAFDWQVKVNLRGV
jgi:hypothetical protein